MTNNPLISCLCVTRDKPALLKRAIRSFHDQTYVNKELIIVFESDDLSTKQFVEQISDHDVFKVEVAASPKQTLGQLRNLSVLKGHGDYFCQWDDDDWYHNSRLEFQMNALKESQLPACVMIQWLVFDATRNHAYVSNMRPWEGSLLCRKSLLAGALEYDETARGEETNLVYKLLLKNLVVTMVMPQLYVYVYHGKNVWGYEHWENIFAASKALPPESGVVIRDILENRHSGEEASRLLDRMMAHDT